MHKHSSLTAQHSKNIYKAVDTYPYTIQFVPACYKTQTNKKMRDKDVDTCPFVFHFVLH